MTMLYDKQVIVTAALSEVLSGGEITLVPGLGSHPFEGQHAWIHTVAG